MQTNDPAAVIQSLARALSAQVIETHISWVLLAGQSAFKIKKPVRLPFVDYSTLEARRHYCEEEVRLNQRLAPGLYLGVVRVTGSMRAPTLDGPGAVRDYAVRMRRFPAGALFSEQLDAGSLTAQQVDLLANLLANFHAHAPRAATGGNFATALARSSAALNVLDGAQTLAAPATLARLRDWLHAQATLLAPLWSARRTQGFVRECHGDLHLANVVSLDGAVLAFDCIEFDPALRWIDVIDDIAFPVMDFAAHDRGDFAWRLLAGWLDATGDHAGLPALRFAVVYRALVRAVVEGLRGPLRAAAAQRYLRTALDWAQPGRPQLCITHGLPGSGKTRASQQFLEREGAIRVRSDVERKRLFALAPHEDSRARGLDIYTTEATSRTYAALLSTARLALQAGYPVVLDAAFLRRDERDQARALAREMDVPFSILDCQAPPQVLRERLLARRGDASEAGVEVLDKLAPNAQALDAEERALVRGEPTT